MLYNNPYIYMMETKHKYSSVQSGNTSFETKLQLDFKKKFAVPKRKAV